jgi:outer membrane receptor protein involved in Fe transport
MVAGLPMQTEIGFQSRYDDIKVALSNTYQRQFWSSTRSDKVKEASVRVYIQNTVHWTGWMRTTLGYRGDFYNTNVNSLLTPANSGNANASIGSPKMSLVFGPFNKTEFFINAGEVFTATTRAA